MGLALWLAMGYVTLVNSAYAEVSETREVLPLTGVWNCYCEGEDEALEYLRQGGLRMLNGIVKVSIPGDFMDFTAQMGSRSCLTKVWYERSFFVPKGWKNDMRVWLQLDGVSTVTQLWINGDNIATLNRSYTPAECDVTEKLMFESENRIALTVDSRTTPLPGTPHSISLRTIPEMLFIESVSVSVTVDNETASIAYKVKSDGLLQQTRKCISIQAFDLDNTLVASDHVCGDLEGTITIPNCHLWWPICMDCKAGYLYTLVFKLYYKYCDSVVRDVYRQKIGVRTLSWSNSSLMINGRNFHLYGVESNDRRLSNPQTHLKDIASVRWLNGNVLFTNVPPSEDMLNLADDLGLLIILGSPKTDLQDVIIRYRNHPSVILWSVSMGENDSPWGEHEDSLIEHAKTLDNTRPFTALFQLSACSPEFVNKLDIISLSLADATLGTGLSTHVRTTFEQLHKPIILMYGDKLLPTNNRIRTLKYDPYPSFNEFERNLDNLDGDVSVVGQFFGNLIAYENFTDECLTVVDGIFNRNHEPTEMADFIRSKFKERRTSISRRIPRCKFIKKHHRKRMD